MTAGLSQEQIAELGHRIQDLLDQECQARGVGFSLKVRESFILEGEIINFIVLPDHQGVRAYDYADVLTKVETKFRKDEGLNVLLVPARAD